MQTSTSSGSNSLPNSSTNSANYPDSTTEDLVTYYFMRITDYLKYGNTDELEYLNRRAYAVKEEIIFTDELLKKTFGTILENGSLTQKKPLTIEQIKEYKIAINRVFLTALLINPTKWSENFTNYLQNIIDSIEPASLQPNAKKSLESLGYTDELLVGIKSLKQHRIDNISAIAPKQENYVNSPVYSYFEDNNYVKVLQQLLQRLMVEFNFTEQEIEQSWRYIDLRTQLARASARDVIQNIISACSLLKNTAIEMQSPLLNKNVLLTIVKNVTYFDSFYIFESLLSILKTKKLLSPDNIIEGITKGRDKFSDDLNGDGCETITSSTPSQIAFSSSSAPTGTPSAIPAQSHTSTASNTTSSSAISSSGTSLYLSPDLICSLKKLLNNNLRRAADLSQYLSFINATKKVSSNHFNSLLRIICDFSDSLAKHIALLSPPLSQSLLEANHLNLQVAKVYTYHMI